MEEQSIITIANLKVMRHSFHSAQRQEGVNDDGTKTYSIAVHSQLANQPDTQIVTFDTEANRDRIFASIEF